ncbi:MAG: SDR family oxidoreductase [Acidobacteriota bacterium]|nr:SDR family oxidoreductase [Acidobacteriota bacterium]
MKTNPDSNSASAYSGDPSPANTTLDTPGVSLSLEGRTALVTGGSRGIGAATVRLFRQAGARVAFSYISAQAQAEALSAELGGATVCLPIRQPLATPEDGEALVAATLSAFGDLDILIANHGIWPPVETTIAAMTTAQWRRTIATNVDSVFGLCHAATAHMLTRERGPAGTESAGCVPLQSARGHIVLIASAAGQRGEAGHADYATSKGAIIALTKSLSSELAPYGIYANCVAPGWTHTEMTGSVFDLPAEAARTNPTIPIGRPAHVTEIAGPILFLCTPFAGFISGEIFNVNGGAVLTG